VANGGMILRSTLRTMSFLNSPNLPETINDGGRCKRWVGIGWVDEGEATPSDTIILEDLHE
jgi:hypothetical protein